MRILVATVALAAVVTACASPTPTPIPTRSPTAVPPGPSTPSLTPVPAVDLIVEATARQGCGSIGGCTYYITIEGDGGSWRAKFGGRGQGGELNGVAGLPRKIPVGIYTLTLSSYSVSDAILNGVRQEFGPDAICSTTRSVLGDQPLDIEGTFDGDSCEIVVSEYRGVPLGRAGHMNPASGGTPPSTT